MSNIEEQLKAAAKEVKEANANVNRARDKQQAAKLNFDSILDKYIHSLIEDTSESNTDSSVNGKGETLSGKLLRIFESDPAKSFNYAELASRMPDVQLKALRVLVYNLNKKGKITKPGYGQFKLK